MLADSHCHLDFPELAERLPQLVESMREAGVGAALCAAVSLEALPKMLSLVERYPFLFASVGVHPDQREGQEPDVATLVRLASHARVVAIGETGLDYYLHKGDTCWQRDRFRTHIRAARASCKPLIVHMRDAAEDTLAILEEEGAGEVGGVMHCFTETPKIASRALDLGFHISLSGIVTFKSAGQIKEVAGIVPLDRLLIETDAPYLAPAPHRGQINQPAYVRHVAEEIARLRGIPLSEVAEATTRNFLRLFSITLN